MHQKTHQYLRWSNCKGFLNCNYNGTAHELTYKHLLELHRTYACPMLSLCCAYGRYDNTTIPLKKASVCHTDEILRGCSRLLGNVVGIYCRECVCFLFQNSLSVKDTISFNSQAKWWFKVATMRWFIILTTCVYLTVTINCAYYIGITTITSMR